MVQSVMCAEESASPTVPVLVPVTEACIGLLEAFTRVGDGRCDQGRDHPVAAVLALAAAATVAGMRGYTAITGWVADVPAAIRHDLYARTGGRLRAGPASRATIWRVLTGADPEVSSAPWLSTTTSTTLSTSSDAGASIAATR